MNINGAGAASSYYSLPAFPLSGTNSSINTPTEPEDPETGAPPSQEATGLKQEALSEDQLRLIEKLKARDAEVRAHEMAHIAAGGGLIISGPVYEYQTGPDNKRYAVGGEVSIDTSAGNTPHETLAKAEKIRAAALAPADPSPQDQQVAAKAGQMAMQAQQEIMQERIKENTENNDADHHTNDSNNESVFTPNHRDIFSNFIQESLTPQSDSQISIYA